ncbi:MAG: NAD(P)H-dependent oxidoreductase [Parcubacteria group bacterium]|nr:NAD(P)H-dependent oxidoreductase [Parcubacteria group bacterium]
MPSLFIPIVLGTARRERQSEKVASYLFGELKRVEGIESEMIDVKEIMSGETVPPWVSNPNISFWKESAGRADGFIFVVPEYNHGYPGELKILLDSLYQEYAYKPVGIASVSAGYFGGARAVENLLPVLVNFSMYPLKQALYFPNIAEMFDENGGIKDTSYKKQTKEFFEELKKRALVMRGLRV